MEQSSAASPPAEAAAGPPGSTPAGADPDAGRAGGPPGFGARGRLRRRVRFLRRARELAYRDLGGLVFDLHRFGQRNDGLVLAKLNTLSRLDAELRALESSLDEEQPVTVLREAGVSACPRCAAIHSSEDRFCPACGLPMSRRVDLPIAGPASTPAADTVNAAAGAAAQAAPGAAAAAQASAAPRMASAPASAEPATAADAPVEAAPAAPASGANAGPGAPFTRPSTSAVPGRDPAEPEQRGRSPVAPSQRDPAEPEQRGRSPVAPSQRDPAEPEQRGRSPVPPAEPERKPEQTPPEQEEQPTEIVHPRSGRG